MKLYKYLYTTEEKKILTENYIGTYSMICKKSCVEFIDQCVELIKNEEGQHFFSDENIRNIFVTKNGNEVSDDGSYVIRSSEKDRILPIIDSDDTLIEKDGKIYKLLAPNQ